jgi:hypothetical protein
MGKKPVIGLDLTETMLASKQAECRVRNSGGAFLNFFLDRLNLPTINSLAKKICHTLVHHIA